MNAILYAAGYGSRLGSSSKKPHKILSEFNGLSLLERHVVHLASLNIPKLYVVTGHARTALAAEFPELQHRYGVEIQEIHNSDYREGSVLSMQASLPVLELVRDGVLLMDGDVLYGREMLERVVKSPHRTALLVDRNYSTEDDDPVLVPMRNGKPFDFTKCWEGKADAIGESIGFFKIDAADVPVLIRETNERLVGERRKESYDDVLRVLAQEGRFGAEDVTGLPWTEIDFPKDLDYAKNVILPALGERPNSIPSR